MALQELYFFFSLLSSHWLPVIIAHALIGCSDHYYQGYLGGAENEGIQNKTLLADKKLNTLVTPEIEMHNERRVFLQLCQPFSLCYKTLLRDDNEAGHEH